MLKTLRGAVGRVLLVAVVMCIPYSTPLALESLTERFPGFFATQMGGSIILVAVFANLFVVAPVSAVLLIAVVVRSGGAEGAGSPES